VPIADEAWQRKIRNKQAAADPRPPAASLRNYTVEMISKRQALPVILTYEWLGDIRGKWFVGLLSPDGTLHGVACFGDGPNRMPNSSIRRIIGSPALCLERGACVHWATQNAASFLISRATRLIYRITDIDCFFAYADPEAGEYGGVYQAANWVYLGQGLDGRNGRTTRTVVLPPWIEDKPTSWQSTRILRRDGRHMTYAEAEAEGWRIKRASDVDAHAAKHVYAVHIGPNRKVWRNNLKILPYPSPRPYLKRRQK
jgi:hypothetical protein